jgi:hypothetical protein
MLSSNIRTSKPKPLSQTLVNTAPSHTGNPSRNSQILGFRVSWPRQIPGLNSNLTTPVRTMTSNGNAHQIPIRLCQFQFRAFP